MLQDATTLNNRRKKRQWWQRLVRVMAMTVVFCTTYVLILPAITMEGKPVCRLEEHEHSEACYEMLPVYEYRCVVQTGDGTIHTHTQQCRVEVGQKRAMVCTKEIHIHSDDCFEENEEIEIGFFCGSGAHTHTESCLAADGTLKCTIPQHTHSASCLVANLSDEEEDRRRWEAQINGLAKTGNWPTDVITVAKSQLGYTESETNVELMNGVLEGYSRYGSWFGQKYAPWNSLFAAFVLSYAGVTDYPVDADADSWMAQLKEENLFAAAEEYAPKAGDLIFIDNTQKADVPVNIPVDVDRVGIVAEILPAGVKVIEGDVDGAVSYVTYPIQDPQIIGYGKIPTGKKILMTHQGLDYTVTVLLDTDAGIPENAILAVQEILPNTDEYKKYYQQSVDALLNEGNAATEAELAVRFARFFDISFLVDGVETEPTAPVDVRICYENTIELEARESGVAVHFAEKGIEVLNAETSKENKADTKVDTFAFTQDSFSVVGTVVSAYTKSIGVTSATTVDFNTVKTTGGTQYVLYVQHNGKYYAITSKTNDAKGYAVEVTKNADGTISWMTNDSGMFWAFAKNGAGNSYYVQNFSTARYIHAFDNSSGGKQDIGTVTGGKNASNLTRQSDGSFIAQGNNYYTGISVAADGTVTFNRVSGQNNAAKFYLALVGEFYNVWFDGTNGGMMSYYGADNLNIPAVKAAGGTTINLPESWNSTAKYPYILKGWYDINTQTYYPVDANDGVQATAKITADTVFYADWIAASYDAGQNNEHVVDSIDTSNFITTYVFDYNVLFNALSVKHTGSISAASHSETWEIVNNGKVPYQNGNTLGFVFVDYDAGGDISYANGRDNTNANQGEAITAGILNEVMAASGKNLLDLLFNPDTDVIGKHYVGTGNYLFQYMDSTTSNYDGIHDGYYYLDARLNAASYNQTQQRFYLYDYLERTSDSKKDGGVGQYSDFLPFNSPYMFEANQLDSYTDSVMRPGYEFDAKDGASSYQEYNSVDDATTNYFFGIRTDIEFFLPNDTNTQDEYGNYGNISTRGEHMVFDFHGDDDVWVFVDGQLLLDIGGLHGVMFGQIDFSAGKILVGKDGGTVEERSFHMSEGTHTMTVYYMERGSSQSNCAIYFNIAPRYDLEITKEDVFTADRLNGAVFAIFNDEAMSSPAQLWESEEAYIEDMKDGIVNDSTNTFTVVDGVAKCWGISAGKTYYIFEKTPPPGYPASDDMIRITLNNRGTATIETTTLHGANGVATEGFAVIKQDINETLKIVALTVTNQKDGDTTEVRVEKTWDESSVDLPKEIAVYLTVNGKRVGRTAILYEGNGWAYTWTGLPKYADEGIDQEIVYVVEEVLVPNYITTKGESKQVENYVDWIRVDQMSDSKTYILVHNGKALSYNGSFGWLEPAEAEKDSGKAAQWSVTTDHDGFHLKNALGYTLTFHANSKNFYGVDNDMASLNQVIYYLNSRLVVHDHDAYYQFGNNGTAVGQDGLTFQLHQKEVFTGLLTGIKNVPVDEENQTYVEVTKVWSDGNDKHLSDTVLIHLYADGKDTGRTLLLNAKNNWTGGFYDLSYYREDGITQVHYTVLEETVSGYVTHYSDPVAKESMTVDVWKNASALSVNGMYRFVYAGYALAVNPADNSIVSVQNDAADPNQQWKAVKAGTKTVLQNVGTGLYLAQNDSGLYTVTAANSAATATKDGSRIKLNTVFLELGASYVGTTGNNANATELNILTLTVVSGRPGVAYTVTNLYGAYKLPATGGRGTETLTRGGLALSVTAAFSALMYLCDFGRKRKKGGI